MSNAGAAFSLSHDAHHSDSRSAEASHSLRESLNPFHHNKHSEEHPVTDQERRRSSVVEFIKKVEHKIIHPGSHEADYKAAVEENERGRKRSTEEARHEAEAVAAAQTADKEEKEKVAAEKNAEEEREREALAGARGAENAAEADVLHAEEKPRRRSLTEKIEDELKHDVDLVKHQASRAKVPVAY